MNSSKWRARPRLAWVLRVVLTALPFAVSLAFSFWARAVFPPERSGIGTIEWIALVWLLALLVLMAVDRVVRRFMPLVALFKLSLVFPDKAPQRFSVALRTGTTKQLQRRIERVNEHGLDPIEANGAIQLLELVASLGEHDRLTRGHCERVRAYTDLIAEEMGLSEDDRSKLHWAALLHDVGKLAVPFDILNSPGRPSEGAWRVLQTHTTRGSEMAEPLRPWLGDWVDAVRSHHERWDGDGYPDQLAEREIPLGARIVAVADAFDVMTSKRSYKEPIDQVEARAEIAACAGSQFDPEVARAFMAIGIGRLRFVMGPLSWLTSLPGAGGSGTGAAISNAATIGAAAATGLVAVVAAPVAAIPDELASTSPPSVVVQATTTTNPDPAGVVEVTVPVPESGDTLDLTTIGSAPSVSTTEVADPTTTTTRPVSTSRATTSLPATSTTTTNGSRLTIPATIATASTTTAQPSSTTTTSTTTTTTSTTTTTTSTTTTSTTTTPTNLSPLAGSLKITEFLDKSGNGGVEFVEVTNTGAGGLNLRDLVVQDYDPDGPSDGPDGDSGNNASFRFVFPSGALPAGKSVVLWLEGTTMPSDPEIWDEHFIASDSYLESTGDDIWLLDATGKVIDYAGWYDPNFAGGNAEEWSGAPDPSLGLCPPQPNCRRLADYDSAARGDSWSRSGLNFVASAPNPGAP